MFAGDYRNLLAKELTEPRIDMVMRHPHPQRAEPVSKQELSVFPNNFTRTVSPFASKWSPQQAKRSARCGPREPDSAGGNATSASTARKILPNGVVEMASNPDGPTDPEVAVVAISDRVGAPLAAFFAYSCHSRTLNSANRLISGDLLGIAEQHVEKAVGGRYVCAAFAARRETSIL